MSHDPLVGQQLAHVRIDRVIGRGGMGQVYLGHDLKLDRPVAVKVIDTRHRSDRGYAERFLREARAVAAWRHEHIVTIYTADDQDGLSYFVMEYIPGEDLGAALGRHAAAGRLPPPAEVLRIGRAIAGALDYAHGRGVIHRDVKPSNVMIAEDRRIVLVDFGLALDVRAGSVGEVFGSARYIAPEQARRSADAVPQSDLYSLGVILYEMVTGSVPFDDPSATSVALQHLTLPPPPPRQLNPALSQAVESVLLKALSKTPADRYPTGAALMAALAEAFAAGEPGVLLADGDRAAGTDPLIGRTLGVYRVEAPLGQGGMASIYRGRDDRLSRTVALKVIDASFQQDSAYARRFEREAQAIGQLEHPNIVRLYEYGDADGLLYMAMEFIDGETLESRLKAHRADTRTRVPARMDDAEALELVRTICRALDYAHGKGVIHRDVKPSNILIDRRGRAVLADFGLALVTEIGTRGEVFGSPHYIAPEQAMSSASAVPQSDLYAIGVILYEMLVGQVPFNGPDSLAIAMQHMTEPPPPPRALRPDLSPAIEAVILRVLSKDPAARYPSGADLVIALEQAYLAPGVALLPAFNRPPPQSRSPTGVARPDDIHLKPTTAVEAQAGAGFAPLPAAIHVRPPTGVAQPDGIQAKPAPAAEARAAPGLGPPDSAISAKPAAEGRASPAPLAADLLGRARRLGKGWLAVGGAALIVLIFLLVRKSDDQPTQQAGSTAVAATGSPGAAALTTPTLPPDLGGAVVIDDGLTAAGWHTQQESGGSMTYQDGRYKLAIPAGTNTFWSLAPNGLGIPDDNVAVSVNVEPIQGKGGILFGFRSLSDHYRLVTQPDGAFSLERRVGRTIETLASGPGAGAGRLSLVLHGSAARIYGGAALLGEVSLPEAPQGGRFGLILVTTEAGEVVFDRLTVRAAP